MFQIVSKNKQKHTYSYICLKIKQVEQSTTGAKVHDLLLGVFYESFRTLNIENICLVDRSSRKVMAILNTENKKSLMYIVLLFVRVNCNVFCNGVNMSNINALSIGVCTF